MRRLSDWERDAFWLDYVRFGELFGMPREVAPPTYAAFAQWWDAKLTSPEMHLTDEARRTGAFVAFKIPMPGVNQAAKRVHDLVMLGSLPPRVRELYGLPWSPAQARAFPLAIAALRGVRAVAPAAVRHGSCARSFALVEATERRRIERGKPTPQLPPLPTSSRGRAVAQASAAATSATAGIASEPSGAANGSVAVASRSQQIRPLTLVERRDDVGERRREVARRRDEVLDVVVADRQRQLLDDRIGEAGVLQQLAQAGRVREVEHARTRGIGEAIDEAGFHERPARDRGERHAVRRAPGGERQQPARAQHAARLAQRGAACRARACSPSGTAPRRRSPPAGRSTPARAA